MKQDQFAVSRVEEGARREGYEDASLLPPGGAGVEAPPFCNCSSRYASAFFTQPAMSTSRVLSSRRNGCS